MRRHSVLSKGIKVSNRRQPIAYHTLEHSILNINFFSFGNCAYREYRELDLLMAQIIPRQYAQHCAVKDLRECHTTSLHFCSESLSFIASGITRYIHFSTNFCCSLQYHCPSCSGPLSLPSRFLRKMPTRSLCFDSHAHS